LVAIPNSRHRLASLSQDRTGTATEKSAEAFVL
jgi:hypothetical protein